MAKVNKLDLALDEYKGGKSTLCPGCGHDAISSVIMKAAWENSITPDGIAKMSGIGCSSKTPAYFLKTKSRIQYCTRKDAFCNYWS